MARNSRNDRAAVETLVAITASIFCGVAMHFQLLSRKWKTISEEKRTNRSIDDLARRFHAAAQAMRLRQSQPEPVQCPTVMTTLPRNDIRDLLSRLRTIHCSNERNAVLGSHQLDALWSLAYAAEASPEPWELYRSAELNQIPTTMFYRNHMSEICEALKPASTYELLQRVANEKIALESKFSDEELRQSGYWPRYVQYYDHNQQCWATVNVKSIRWFDSRELMERSQEQDEASIRKKHVDRLRAHLREYKSKPSELLRQSIAAQRRYIRIDLPAALARREKKKSTLISCIEKLNETGDFRKDVFHILREAENQVRAAHGIGKVGETWVSETELLYRVKRLFSELEVIAHGRPHWLGRQHLDIWIPALCVGIEYQGIQHFEPVKRFGGEEAHYKTRARDERKRKLCLDHGVRLIEIKYDQSINDTVLETMIRNTSVL